MSITLGMPPVKVTVCETLKTQMHLEMLEGNESRELRISAHRECEVSSARTEQRFRNSCEIKHKLRSRATGSVLIFGGGKQHGVRLSALSLSH